MNIQEYIQEYGIPPPNSIISGYRNPNDLLRHVKSLNQRSIISGYQNPNQHHNGHHDGHHKENYTQACFTDRQCHQGSCQDHQWWRAGAGICK